MDPQATAVTASCTCGRISRPSAKDMPAANRSQRSATPASMSWPDRIVVSVAVTKCGP